MTATIIESQNLHKIDPVFGQQSFNDHEQVIFCNDKDTGLKAIIGIHSTILGPALGGTRMWNYSNEWDALNDVLRLSRGMTFKAAITGLNLGGGKAVIIGNSKTDKSPELIKKFGEFVGSLSGRYITAEDVGTTTADMDLIKTVTNSVTGISESNGGSGNPSPSTAFGVYMGMKAAAKFQFGSDNLSGKKIVVQGVGHVGEILVEILVKEGANVIIDDINQQRLSEVSSKYGATIYNGTNIYQEETDIYSPCALGATINDETVYQIKAKVIAGAANNQLLNENVHGQILANRGVLYAPDFLINAGGIINIYREVSGYSKIESQLKLENIYNTTLDICNCAEQNKITTQQAAMQMAQQTIEKRKQEKA
jgi:leucine dehydrogenase